MRSLVVPGLGLWRSGHRGAASAVAAVALGAPTAVAFAVLWWPRDHSHDSRAFGPVAASQVVGVASAIHFSWPRVGRSGRGIDP